MTGTSWNSTTKNYIVTSSIVQQQTSIAKSEIDAQKAESV